MTEIERINKNIFESKRREIYWQLKEIGLEEQECNAEALLIIEHLSGLSTTQQLIKDIDEFPAQWQQEITRIISLRRERRPLVYCLGETEFAGLKYKIIPGVLIPRTDTETLVEAVVEWVQRKIDAFPVLNIAEIGVGSGIIAISLLKRLSNCRVWACDISQAAIGTALGNARRHGVHERLTLVHGDWKKVLPNDFDVLVSNPPYMSSLLNTKSNTGSNTRSNNRVNATQGENTKKLQPEIYFEPQEALFAGEDGLDFYRDFASILPGLFRKLEKNKNELNLSADLSGALFGAFEIGDEQEKAVLSIFKNNGWHNLESKCDVNGLPRVITGMPPGFGVRT